MGTGPGKQAYTISCASAFRDRVLDLARRRRANVGDLARSVLLLMPEETVAAFADPGGPPGDDRETVVLKSGPSAGRPWRRKPRLQLRLAPGYPESMIRRALALALALEAGGLSLRLEEAAAPVAAPAAEPARPIAADRDLIGASQDELIRLKAMISVLSFEPLPEGIKSRADALHVLGFAPGASPAADAVRARFRMLAAIHHPDGGQGSHQRMSQLNAAMDFLRRRAA